MQESHTNQLVENSSHNEFKLCHFDELTPTQLKSRKDFKLEDQHSNIHKAFLSILPDKEQRKRKPYNVLYVTSSEKIVGFVVLKLIQNLPNDFKKKVGLPPKTEVIQLCFLAIDLEFRDRGFGELLLLEAISRSKEYAAENPECSILCLQAADEVSAKFYEKYGLDRPTNSLDFVLPLHD